MTDQVTTVEGEDARVVTLVKRKLHGGRACWLAYLVLVAADVDGSWLYTPAGSTFRSSDGKVTVDGEVEGGDGPGLDSLVLVPEPTQHWLANWRVPQRALQISVEICGWERRDRDLVSFIDWELDPFRMRSGLVAVEDLDDFVEARDGGQLGGVEAQQALVTAGTIERALKRQTPPFDGRGDALLIAAGRLDLKPLTRVPDPFDV